MELDDLTQLTDGGDLLADITAALCARLSGGVLFTRVGASLLVSMNPYAPATLGAGGPPLFSAAALAHFRCALPGFQAPHLFDVAARVRAGLAAGVRQAVLCSGESGSGKTECARVLLGALAAAGSPACARLLTSNLLLEAFGNAATAKNDNSSRL